MHKPDVVPDEVLDITGEICPITFARTKIALEMMQVGQVLEVYLDYPPAAVSVPRSVGLMGDEVLAVAQEDEQHWRVWIRKRVL